MHVRVDLRPKIIVHQFSPKVHTYLKSTSGEFFFGAKTELAVKLLSENDAMRMTLLRFLSATRSTPLSHYACIKCLDKVLCLDT
jgi:hypothetical protein